MPTTRRPQPSTDHRPGVGRVGERHAREHLVRRGFTIVAERARTRWGELDLVACDETTIVFCEVKARVARSGSQSMPWTSLHAGKQRQVRRLAAAWLAETPDRPRARELRFDAIGVLLDRHGRLLGLEHLEAAF